MPKKTITIFVKAVDADYWHSVKEFALHRRITLKTLVLAALDEYITRHRVRENKNKKEVEVYDNTRR